jgi:hypothetical protein
MDFLTESVRQLEIEKSEGSEDIDWERAFKVLALSCCVGFVSSTDTADKIEILNAYADPRVGAYLAELFNRHRSNWMQEFMG